MKLSSAQTKASLRRHEEELAAEEAFLSVVYPSRAGSRRTIDYGIIGVAACGPVMIAVALLFTFLSMTSLYHFVNEWVLLVNEWVLLVSGVVISLGALVGTLKFFFWLDLRQY